MNEDKKKERKNSLILGAAAISAVTVFGIILNSLIHKIIRKSILLLISNKFKALI